jgi:hypothetical protein
MMLQWKLLGSQSGSSFLSTVIETTMVSVIAG